MRVSEYHSHPRTSGFPGPAAVTSRGVTVHRHSNRGAQKACGIGLELGLHTSAPALSDTRRRHTDMTIANKLLNATAALVFTKSALFCAVSAMCAANCHSSPAPAPQQGNCDAPFGCGRCSPALQAIKEPLQRMSDQQKRMFPLACGASLTQPRGGRQFCAQAAGSCGIDSCGRSYTVVGDVGQQGARQSLSSCIVSDSDKGHNGENECTKYCVYVYSDQRSKYGFIFNAA